MSRKFASGPIDKDYLRDSKSFHTNDPFTIVVVGFRV